MFLSGAAALALTAGLFSLSALPAEAESAADLFLPASYEQYLPLERPSDAAMNENYTVIADGSVLYIYDKAAGEYSRYPHEPLGVPRNITKLGFTSDGRLFFSDQDAQLYRYDFTASAAEIQSNIPCSTFVIDGDTLYTTAISNGTTTFLAFPHRGAGLSYERRRFIGDLSMPTSIAPHMFVKDGVLYCAINSHVYAYTDNGDTFDQTELLLSGGQAVQDLTSVAVFGGQIYYTVNDALENENDGIYLTQMDNASKPVLLLEGDGFNALFSYGESLYCICGASVRELKVDGTTASYTGYEIAAGSDSFNRISNAGDTVRARDLLVTADRGNGRVSVLDTRTGEFSLLQTGEASYVATDGEVIAAAVGNQVKLYRYGGEEPYYTHTSANAVTGVAVVCGECYYVTEHHYGVAREGAQEFTRQNSPVALTSDIYGNLYVADRQSRVLQYTEEEFLDDTVDDGQIVTEDWSLPREFGALRADYDGGIYYLSGNTLYKNGERLSLLDGSGCVYHAEKPAPALVSFALGFEDNSLYLQYGDYIAVTGNVSFPTLSTIAATDVYSEVFASPDGSALSLTDVNAGSTGIRVGADRLEEDSLFFPYESYYRTQEGGRGILLCERGKFSLVALFEDYGYTVALYRTEDCTEASAKWTNVTPAERYTTSSVALCYYPCLSEQLEIARLPRGSVLTLLAEVDTGDGFEYAYARSGSVLGYVPLSYLTPSSPLELPPEEFTLGYLKASEKGVLFYNTEDPSETLLITERTQIMIYGYDAESGLYSVCIEKDGKKYTAQITDRMIQTGNPDALRLSLIVVLCALAVGVVTAFVLFYPRKKKKLDGKPSEKKKTNKEIV